MACALAPVSNATVIKSFRQNSVIATTGLQKLSAYLKPTSNNVAALAAQPPRVAHKLGQLPVTKALASGSQVTQTADRGTPFRPDPVTGLIMISAFAFIGSTLRERKHDGVNLPLA